jgi:hypothetical protein
MTDKTIPPPAEETIKTANRNVPDRICWKGAFIGKERFKGRRQYKSAGKGDQ